MLLDDMIQNLPFLSKFSKPQIQSFLEIHYGLQDHANFLRFFFKIFYHLHICVIKCMLSIWLYFCKFITPICIPKKKFTLNCKSMSIIFGIFRSYKLAQTPFRVFLRKCHKEPTNVLWKKPEIGWTKLNFDGSCKLETGKASIGGVVRDHNAEFLLGYAEPIGKATSTIAEVVALQRGLELVLENGYTDLWLEGDYKTLMDIIAHKRNVKCVELQKRVTSINLILPEFRNYYVTHVHRQGNRLADKFAKMGHELIQPQVWHVPPCEVMKIVDEDANGKVNFHMQ